MGTITISKNPVDCLHNSYYREPKISNEMLEKPRNRNLRPNLGKNLFLPKEEKEGADMEISPQGGNEVERVSSTIGQAIKSARGMPWHQEPTKDVTSCDKLRGGANIH